MASDYNPGGPIFSGLEGFKGKSGPTIPVFPCINFDGVEGFMSAITPSQGLLPSPPGAPVLSGKMPGLFSGKT